MVMSIVVGECNATLAIYVVSIMESYIVAQRIPAALLVRTGVTPAEPEINAERGENQPFQVDRPDT